MAATANAWIFQGNPKLYDVAGALKEMPEIPWVVRQHRQDVHAGDRVYVWQAGPEAGILATATALAEPAVMDPVANDRFTLNEDAFPEPELQVVLRIDHVLAEPLSKREISHHERLRDLTIIRSPTGTNFRVTPDQKAALEELIAATGPQTEPPSNPKWQEAIRLCRDILADRAGFDEGEVTYKHQIAANIRAAFDAADSGGPVGPAIKKALGKPNNLVHYLQMAWFKDWMQTDDDRARRALLALKGPGSTAERVDAFNAEIPPEVLKQPGAKIAFASFFLMGSDPARYPMYRARAIKGAEQLLAWPAVPADASLGEEYEHHVAFLAHFRQELTDAGLDVRDLLDAQSLVWMLMRWGNPEFKAFRGEARIDPDPPPEGDEPTSLEELASELYIDSGFLHTAVDLLEEKRQLIFYGPPGTGKTYIARRLAQFLASGDPQRSEIVQFHPSYSYEDFVQGYRPRPDVRGNLTYELVDGPLLRLAEQARADPDEPHVLLVDEINRGNLPRIFGELLYLLEYRDDQMALMYSGADSLFALPDNLWVIGTMNTADRSIGLIDAALRRRFHFVALFPGRPPLDGLLERWLADKAPTMTDVATYVDRLNAKLRERFGEHLQVGHSYFMIKGLDERRLERIWEVDILPFLEDQLFGKEDELEQFRLTAIKRDAAREGPKVAVSEPTDADDQPHRIPDEH